MKQRKAVDRWRLWAAHEAKGGSWHQLAKAAGVSHPTISRLFSRKIKAVNARTLARLAAALRVPAAWLTGEQRALPYVPEWHPLDRKREGPSLWDRPPASAIRDSWLMQRIEAALRRDLNEWCGRDGPAAYDSWGRPLLALFNELSSSVAWRTLCLEPSPAGSWHAVLQSDDSPSIDWLTHVLEPWFAGRAYLNAGILRDVFETLVANPERMWGVAVRDEDVLRGLERYGATLSESTAKLGEGTPKEARESGEKPEPVRARRTRRRGGAGSANR